MRVIRSLLLLVSVLVVAAPTARAQTQSTAPSVAIDDLTVNAGLMTYRIPHLEVFGSNASTADLRQLFDANDPKPLPDRVRTLNAERVVVPELLIEWKVGQAAQSATYHNLVLTGVSGGHVTDASAQSVSMALVDENASKISGEFSSLAAHNIDLVLAARIAASNRADSSEPKTLLYESFSLDGGGLVAPKENVEITFGRMAGGNIKARPFSAPLGIVPKEPHELTPEEKRVMAGYAADALDTFDIGSFDVRDIRFKGLADTGPFTGHFDRVAIAGMGDARIEEFSFGGFSTKTADGIEVGFGNLAFRGFDMSAMRSRLRAASADTAQPLEDANARELVPSLREFSLSGFEYQGASSGGAIIAAVRRDSVRLAKLEMRGSEVVGGIPTTLSANMEGLSFNVSPTASDDSLRTIAGLGYSSVDLGSRMDLAWKQPAQEIAVNDVSLAANGMGTFRLTGTLGNVSKDLFASEPAVMQAAALAVLVKNAGLTVTDQGLLDRMIANEAKRSGRTPAAVRSEWVTAAGIGIPAALGDAPAGRVVGAAVSKFIAKPTALHIAANAPNGIGVPEIMLFSQDPAAFLKRMDVQASVD